MVQSPIIGITTYGCNEIGEFYLPEAYVHAVRVAGGLPLMIPPNQPDLAQLLCAIDGLIFSGGGDINPSLYGDCGHPTLYMMDSERDQCELALAKLALSSDVPTLGICRGMQILNVASGGSLVAHVPDLYGEAVEHRLDHPRRSIEHVVRVDSTTRLEKILEATEISVISWHHQAVKMLPDCWQALAWASDGLIEAIEHQHHPWLIAVQWHPEMSPLDSKHARLFRSLVEAAHTDTKTTTRKRVG
jgi:putative glutamine amidotransferase